MDMSKMEFLWQYKNLRCQINDQWGDQVYVKRIYVTMPCGKNGHRNGRSTVSLGKCCLVTKSCKNAPISFSMFVRKQESKNHLEDLGVDDRIILTWILKNSVCRCIGFIPLIRGSSASKAILRVGQVGLCPGPHASEGLYIESTLYEIFWAQ